MLRVLQSANRSNSSLFARFAEVMATMIDDVAKPSHYAQMQPLAATTKTSPVRRPRRRRHPRTSSAAIKTTWF